MPYFVGQSAMSGNTSVRSYFGEGFDGNSQPRELSSYYQRQAYFADPERNQDPSLAAAIPPSYLRLAGNPRTLPDHIAGVDGYAHLRVSDRVRFAIERLEPGRHYFSPLTILHRDLTPWPEPYWLFRAAPSAITQAMIVEQSSSLRWEPMERPYAAYNRRMNCVDKWGYSHPIMNISGDEAKGFVLDENAFRDRHIVLEEALQSKRIFYFSDVLVTTLKAEKVSGFKFVKVKAEPRTVPPYGALNGSGAVA